MHGSCFVFASLFTVCSLMPSTSDSSSALNSFFCVMAFLLKSISPPVLKTGYFFGFASFFAIFTAACAKTAKKRASLALLQPSVSPSRNLMKASRSIFTGFPSAFRGTQERTCLYPAAYIRSRYASCFSLLSMRKW
jgi:hypothetical protein